MGEYLLYSERDILERVDEYSLYCYYTGMEIVIGGSQHLSPVRASLATNSDVHPSFGVYARKYGHGPHEFMWKDQGKGLHGDIFDLVKVILRLNSRKDAMFRIMADFAIGGTITDSIQGVALPKAERRYADPIDIDIKSRPFDKRDDLYWGKYNVNRSLLSMYSTKALSCYWIAENQTIPSYPKGLGYSYQIWDKYKLYFPSATREHKFRNNFTEACLEGFQQLQYNSPLLVITKSTKDVMCLRSFGYESVSPRGENVLVPEPFLEHFESKYRRILILFDNDMKHRGHDYKYDKVYVPQSSKDVSDFCHANGPDACAEMLQQIIGV